MMILERPQRAECHLSLVDVTEHCSHKQQSLLSEFKRIHNYLQKSLSFIG